jgi:hypothetical protein
MSKTRDVCDEYRDRDVKTSEAMSAGAAMSRTISVTMLEECITNAAE